MCTHPHTLIRTLLLTATTATTITTGAPIELVVDPNQSVIDLFIGVDVSVASDTDSASSTLSGSIEVEVDSSGNPTQISLHGLSILIDQSMNYDWSFGFFGSADATLAGGGILYGTPGFPTGPVPVESGSFEFPEIPISLDGLLNASYDIFLVGDGSESIVLSEQGQFASSFSGDIDIQDDVMTVTSVLPLSTTQPLLGPDGSQIGTITMNGTATVVASGVIDLCEADMNNDGQLDFFDVSDFLDAFNAQDSAADFDENGSFDFFDVSGFLDAFIAGCP